MKTALFISTIFAICGLGMTFHIKEYMNGKFTVITPKCNELFAGLLQFLEFCEADVKKVMESEFNVGLELKVVKDDGPDYAIEIQHLNNPIQEKGQILMTVGKRIVVVRKDGKPYNVDMIVKDKDLLEVTATMQDTGLKCTVTFNFKKEGAHVSYKCDNKAGETHEMVLDYKRE